MEIAVVYASRTGGTRRAAQLIASAVEERGHSATCRSVDDLDFGALARADLVIVGTWVDGLFVIGQRPGDGRRTARIPVLTGKDVAIFLTYAINPGGALRKMEKAYSAQGANVVGGYAWQRNSLPAGIEAFVDAVLGAAKTSA